MHTFTLDQQHKNRKTVYNVQVIRNTAHRPSTQASYTASRVRLNKENQMYSIPNLYPVTVSVCSAYVT